MDQTIIFFFPQNSNILKDSNIMLDSKELAKLTVTV